MLQLHHCALAVMLVACSNDMPDYDTDVRNSLTPTGELRVAVAVGPAVSATFATENPVTGELFGPTPILAKALADELGVAVRYLPYSSSGEITRAAPHGDWDVTFVPIDAARAELIDFGPAYSVFDSTLMIRAGVELASIAALDAPSYRIGAVDNTTTARAIARVLQSATLSTYSGVEELRDRLRRGELDAIALSRIALTRLASDVPGSRILDEAFHTTATAIAIPKGRDAALGLVSAFVENAKRSGLARRALDEAGLTRARVAP